MPFHTVLQCFSDLDFRARPGSDPLTRLIWGVQDHLRSSYPAELISALLDVMSKLDERRVLGWLTAAEGVTAEMSLPKQVRGVRNSTCRG